MDDLKVLITACGTPGFIPLFKQLKKIKERDIHIIGTDMDMNASGKFYVDKFYQVPPASNTDYQQQMIDIIKKENPDIILPESSLEIEKISLISYLYPEYKFMVNDDHVIKFIENKHELYEYLSYVIPENIPEYYAPKNISDFRYFAEKLGYPDKTICFKPFIGKGSRGFRIIDENIDSYDILFNQRPGKNIYMKINEFADIVYDKEFPDILLNEFVEGTEYDCMVLANEDSEALLTTVKVRKKSKYGLSWEGELVDSPEHVELCEKISKALRLQYCNGIQFIGDKLIEVNPRLSTYIYDNHHFCEPYIAMKMALGELTDDEVRSYQDKIPIGRKFIRTTDQIFYD